MASTVAEKPAGTTTGPRLLIGVGRLRLVLASALMLFVELALIRWTSRPTTSTSESTSPTSSCWRASSASGWGSCGPRQASDLFPLASRSCSRRSCAFVLLVFPVRTGTGRGGTVAARGPVRPGPPLPLVRWASWPSSSCSPSRPWNGARPGGGLRTLRHLRPARGLPAATSVGSLTGIVAFAALSFLRLPPLGWGLVGCRRVRSSCSAACAARAGRLPAVALAALVLMLGRRSPSWGKLPVVALLQDPHRTTWETGGLVRIEGQQHAAAEKTRPAGVG